MTEHEDPLLKAVADLATITPDAKWEAGVRAACHREMARQARRRPGLLDAVAAAVLAAYLSAVLVNVARFAGLW